MFSRGRTASGTKSKGAPGLSFIAADVVVSGDISTTAQLHIDGRIDGNVSCGQLVQGEGGVVAGTITADEARLSGTVEGPVNARTLVVEATARVLGDLAYETISIAAGAEIQGRLARRDALAAGVEATTAGPARSARAKPAATVEEDGLFLLPEAAQVAAE
jgi:cytoskeletal protein CcmA (bactofilin family)